jgi:hypothetical protein
MVEASANANRLGKLSKQLEWPKWGCDLSTDHRLERPQTGDPLFSRAFRLQRCWYFGCSLLRVAVGVHASPTTRAPPFELRRSPPPLSLTHSKTSEKLLPVLLSINIIFTFCLESDGHAFIPILFVCG